MSPIGKTKTGGSTAVRWVDAFNACRDFLRGIHSRAYLAAKAREFNLVTRATTIAAIFFIPCSVFFDYALTREIGLPTWRYVLAQEAVMLVWACISWRNLDTWIVRLCTILAPLALEIGNIERLALIHQGGLYGSGSVVYFFIFTPLLLISQPLLLVGAVLLLVAVFPMLIAPLGVSADFDWAVYNAYSWLAFGPTILIIIMFEYLNWNVFSARRRIEIEAVTDGLTRVANRNHFLTESARSLAFHWRERRPLAMLFIDIDHFKTINDTYGHRLGDDALQHIVTTLRHVQRESDLLGRYGGDEFLVLLSETDLEAAMAVAQRMNRAVALSPVDSQYIDTPLEVTLSIGVACVSSPQDTGIIDIDALIHLADLALYDAKRQGRNRVVGRQLGSGADMPAAGDARIDRANDRSATDG